MPDKVAYCLQKRRYAQISVKKRLEMVRLVEVEGRSYSDAGRKLHANPSTVRLIIKKYKETGTIFMKKLRNTSKPDPLSVKLESQPILVKAEATEMDDPQQDLSNQKQQKSEAVKVESAIKKEEPICPFYTHLPYRY